MKVEVKVPKPKKVQLSKKGRQRTAKEMVGDLLGGEKRKMVLKARKKGKVNISG